MHRSRKTSFLFLFLLLSASVTAATGQTRVPSRVYLIEIKSDVKKIESDARKALSTKVGSVVSKEATPPSGDKHDYMSQAPYFWRNPNTTTGLPYVRRDGERNPEIKKYPDHDLLDTMIVTVERLSLGYFVTGKEEYAVHAGEILRMWFLDSSTKMNPNLEFAQAIPGINTGRGIGIIETRGLTRVVDSVGLLAGSKSWTKSDQAGMEAWFTKYLSWLMTSKHGNEESAAKNNHGTFYDVQLASFALFVGNRELAKATLEAAKQKRIAAQIEKEGRQPLELERTRSWDYSVMNLEGLMALAILAEHVGIDLWNYRTANSGGIRNAILFLAPFERDTAKWPYKQISATRPDRLGAIVRRTSMKYKDAEFQKLVGSIETK